MPATATVTIVLAMATLGDATLIGLFLFMPCRPRWPRQVSDCCVLLSLPPALSCNFRKWKYGFTCWNSLHDLTLEVHLPTPFTEGMAARQVGKIDRRLIDGTNVAKSDSWTLSGSRRRRRRRRRRTVADDGNFFFPRYWALREIRLVLD